MNLSEKQIQDLKEKKISIEDLDDRYFINSQYRFETENILKLLNENICSFKELVDRVKSIKDSDNDLCLYKLLENKKLFKELFENNKLNADDLRYLLNRLDDIFELYKLCENISLIKRILNAFVLDKETVDKLNTILENDDYWCNYENIHTLFELTEYHHKDNKDNSILKLNELNEQVCLLTNFDLTDEQRLEIHEILRSNEIARNTLIQIIDNHLEDTYDFETLKNLLTKDDNKKLKTKLNF